VETSKVMTASQMNISGEINARMVCQVYTVPSSKVYISVKSGWSPGKPRMFLYSFNVAGVVFKTDGGREGLLLL